MAVDGNPLLNKPLMVMDGTVEPSALPEAPEGSQWRKVKYIKVQQRKYKENLELRFKDLKKTGVGFKKELEDYEQARKD